VDVPAGPCRGGGAGVGDLANRRGSAPRGRARGPRRPGQVTPADGVVAALPTSSESGAPSLAGLPSRTRSTCAAPSASKARSDTGAPGLDERFSALAAYIRAGEVVLWWHGKEKGPDDRFERLPGPSNTPSSAEVYCQGKLTLHASEQAVAFVSLGVRPGSLPWRRERESSGRGHAQHAHDSDLGTWFA
jgi:hypothetical protein